MLGRQIKCLLRSLAPADPFTNEKLQHFSPGACFFTSGRLFLTRGGHVRAWAWVPFMITRSGLCGEVRVWVGGWAVWMERASCNFYICEYAYTAPPMPGACVIIYFLYGYTPFVLASYGCPAVTAQRLHNGTRHRRTRCTRRALQYNFVGAFGRLQYTCVVRAVLCSILFIIPDPQPPVCI
jgi:hypothetical protein